jgi:hypothetical protein
VYLRVPVGRGDGVEVGPFPIVHKSVRLPYLVQHLYGEGQGALHAGGKATSGKKPFTLCVHNLLNKETMIYYNEEVYSLLEYVRHQH